MHAYTNKFVCILLIAALAGGCRTGRYADTNKRYKKQVDSLASIIRQYPLRDAYSADGAEWVGTTNFNLRKPNFVIIHHTAQNSCEQTTQTFTKPASQVSAHYVICKDGKVHHILNDYLRSWHAGASKWGNTTDVNSASIGIELDNNGAEPFTPEQIGSLLQVLASLKKSYSIPVANFIGHSDIAPGRKVDPNKNFPWQQLSQQGYGLWYDTTAVRVPEGFDPMQALRIIGYDIRKPASAVSAFKLHFLPVDTTAGFTDESKKILVSLMKQSE